ncbi:hypothetical protein OG21DRAFT_1462799 [Imleria badia]|nr:hypothetical protein OG21DRAFT_1462799 [Imleria badia]
MPSAIHTGPPTHPALYVRDAKDAHIVLEAVRLNILPLIRRRLTANEREQLVSGNVFVWEEAENDGGLLRWTDGRRWSQSRMRGDYLFYEEKMETTQEEKDAKAALRVRRATDPLAVAPPTNRRRDRPNRPNGLTKQTYSALVHFPGSSQPRKWHVVAYFTGDDYLRLPVIESYNYLRSLRVPEGVFASSKANGARSDRHSVIDSREVPSGSLSISPSPSSPLTPILCYPYSLPAQSTTSRPCPNDTPLPGIATLTSPHPHTDLHPNSHASHPVRLNHPSPSNYRPLSAEDRRVLSSFRVVL